MFGPESPGQLNSEMGFSVYSADTNINEPSQNFIYSYPGSPTTGPSSRYSWRSDQYNGYLNIPGGTAEPEGWVTVPLYLDTSAYTSNGHIIKVFGQDIYDSIYFNIQASGEVRLYIDDTLQSPTFTPSGLSNNWNYWALKYTMTGSTWAASVYLNGVEILSGSKTGGGVQAETVATVRFNGPCTGDRTNYFGQIICYDDLTDQAQVPFQYVTRVNPTVDTDTTGSWTAVGGSTNSEVLSGSFDSSTYTVNTGSATGDKVICQVTGALGLITQLGTTPSSIDGITVHCWASGSGQNGFTGLSDDNTTYTSGSHITPDINDPTYCFSTDALQPSDDAAWNATSSLYIKYEVS
jgi:hypothetical protein